MKRIRITEKEMENHIKAQDLNHQRIPYPLRLILEKAGLEWNQIRTVDPSHIECSPEYADYAMKFDRAELRRMAKQEGPDFQGWLPGGWWLGTGPLLNKEAGLDKLEFIVHDEKIRAENAEEEDK